MSEFCFVASLASKVVWVVMSMGNLIADFAQVKVELGSGYVTVPWQLQGCFAVGIPGGWNHVFMDL